MRWAGSGSPVWVMWQKPKLLLQALSELLSYPNVCFSYSQRLGLSATSTGSQVQQDAAVDLMLITQLLTQVVLLLSAHAGDFYGHKPQVSVTLPNSTRDSKKTWNLWHISRDNSPDSTVVKPNEQAPNQWDMSAASYLWAGEVKRAGPGTSLNFYALKQPPMRV